MPLENDTIVVPARPKGFREVFLGKKSWPNLKICGSKTHCIKYIAVYQTSPVSAITHYAIIKEFRPLGRKGRFDVILEEDPVEIKAVRFTADDVCAVQGPRYTTLINILSATHLALAFPA